MRTPHRRLALATVTLLGAMFLTACNTSTPDTTATTTTHQAAPTSTAPPTTAAAQQDPQQRITAYLQASDAAAASGWKDNSYLDQYLVPQLAQSVRAEDEKYAATGATITSQRKLSNWTLSEQTDTSTTIEFCDDTTGAQATKDGKPYPIGTTPGPSVAQYKLARSSTSEPWMIEQTGYYPEGTTCVDHFGH